MSTALYNNTCEPAPTKTAAVTHHSSDTHRHPATNLAANLDIIEGNRLHLLSEHSLIVYHRCLDQLALCQLSPRCSRVFYSILNQTIGHSKLEDNMTTTRLEQLTQIRHDHAGQAMKDLAAMNIIIHRAGGKYRNWLSINFNFAMWGNLSLAASHKSNNPALLLPSQYTETPIDNGLQLDPANLQDNPPQTLSTPLPHPSESTQHSVSTPPIAATIGTAPTETQCDVSADHTTKTQCDVSPDHTTKTQCDVSANPANADAIETLSELSQNAELSQNTAINPQTAQKLEEKLTQLFSTKLSSVVESIHQRLQGFEQHLSSVMQSKTFAPQPAQKQAQKQDQQQDQKQSKTEQKADTALTPVKAILSTITAQTEQSLAHKSAIPQPDQTPLSTQKHQTHKQVTQAVVVASSDPYIKIAAFNYPEILDAEQRQSLQGLLVKAGDRAQDLLNLLAQRLQNTRNPVVEPASYFASLVYKLRNGDLDFSGLKVIKPAKSAKEKAQVKQFQDLKIHHRECHNAALHFQGLIERDMRSKAQSFKEVCEGGLLGGIIEDCNSQLASAKQALDDFVASNKTYSSTA